MSPLDALYELIPIVVVLSVLLLVIGLVEHAFECRDRRAERRHLSGVSAAAGRRSRGLQLGRARPGDPRHRRRALPHTHRSTGDDRG